MSNCLQHHRLQPARLLCPWDFPGKSITVGCRFLLQGVLLSQGLNPRLLHRQVDSLRLSHLGSPVKNLPITKRKPCLWTRSSIQVNFSCTGPFSLSNVHVVRNNLILSALRVCEHVEGVSSSWKDKPTSNCLVRKWGALTHSLGGQGAAGLC